MQSLSPGLVIPGVSSPILAADPECWQVPRVPRSPRAPRDTVPPSPCAAGPELLGGQGGLAGGTGVPENRNPGEQGSQGPVASLAGLVASSPVRLKQAQVGCGCCWRG